MNPQQYRRNRQNSPNWQDVADTNKPLLDALASIATDVREVRSDVALLKETHVRPEMVYTREMIDSMLKLQNERFSGIEQMIRDQKDQLVKLIGFAIAILTLLTLFQQHIVIH